MPRHIPRLTRFYLRNSQKIDDILAAVLLLALVATLIFLPDLLS